MTVLGSLLRSSLEGTKPLTDASLGEWLTGARSDAGVAVTEQRVLGLPAYYRAVATTAGTVAGLPLHVYQRGTRDLFSRPTVLDRPNPRQTPIEWKLTLLAHGITWGNAFNRKLRNGAGEVVQVWPLHPSRVRVVEVDITDQNPEGKLFLVRDRHGAEQRYTSWDIFHVPYMSYDGLSGVRPLEVFRQALGIPIAGDDSTARFLKNGSRLSGILKTASSLDRAQADRIKARWKAMTSGSANAGEIAVLDNDAEFQAVSLPPGDAKLLESRQWSVLEVARMVGTPPHLIGEVTGSTSWGTGIEQQVLGWVKFTLGTWITSIEQRTDAELIPARAYSKLKLEGLLRGDSKARAAFYHSAITDGWMTRNEVRELEDLERADGLDEFIAPSNMTLLSVDGSIVPLSAAGTAGDTD